jgi:hypothetical protein
MGARADQLFEDSFYENRSAFIRAATCALPRDGRFGSARGGWVRQCSGCGVPMAGLARSSRGGWASRDRRSLRQRWSLRPLWPLASVPPPIGLLPIATPSGFPDSRQRARAAGGSLEERRIQCRTSPFAGNAPVIVGVLEGRGQRRGVVPRGGREAAAVCE